MFTIIKLWRRLCRNTKLTRDFLPVYRDHRHETCLAVSDLSLLVKTLTVNTEATTAITVEVVAPKQQIIANHVELA